LVHKKNLRFWCVPKIVYFPAQIRVVAYFSLEKCTRQGFAKNEMMLHPGRGVFY